MEKEIERDKLSETKNSLSLWGVLQTLQQEFCPKPKEIHQQNKYVGMGPKFVAQVGVIWVKF